MYNNTMTIIVSLSLYIYIYDIILYIYIYIYMYIHTASRSPRRTTPSPASWQGPRWLTNPDDIIVYIYI